MKRSNAGTFADLKHLAGRKNTNVALDFQLRRGDVEKAFASADHVFRAPIQDPTMLARALESHASLAIPGEGTLTIHTSSQTPCFRANGIARLLGWPENRVHVKGAFFRRRLRRESLCKVEPLARACVKSCGAREDRSDHGRAILHHQQARNELRIKSGVSKDGRIVAAQMRCGIGMAAPTPTSVRVSLRKPVSPRRPLWTSRMFSIDSY